MPRLVLAGTFCLAALLVSCNGDETTSHETEIVRTDPVWHDLGRPLREAFGIAGPIPNYPGEVTKRAVQLDLAEAIGLSHYRHEILWSRVEGPKGVFDFSAHDTAIDEGLEHGQSLLGIVAYGNHLYSEKSRANGNSHHYPPDEPEDIRGYAAALAEHYKGRIDRWEFWNEPNGGYRFWKTGPGGDPVAFAALAVEAATAMRKANSEITLALGGLFYHDYIVMPGAPRFLEAVIEARPELIDLYDAVSFHPYKPYPPGDPPEMAGSWDEEQDTTIDVMREVMQRNGMGEHEIWITENGWPVGPLVNETQQAQYLVRGALLAFARGVVEYDWYTFWDYEDPSKALVLPEAYFGIVSPGELAKGIDYDLDGDNPPRLKPGYFAAKALLEFAGDATTVADVTPAHDRGMGARLIALEGPNTKVIVAWHSAIGGLHEVDVPAWDGAGPKEAFSMLGDRLEAPAATESHTLIQSPVYWRY